MQREPKQHTPTPWLVEAATIYAVHLPTDRLLRDGEASVENRFFAHFNPGRGVSPDEARENAHFAVRAVNNFEALVESLRELYEYQQQISSPDTRWGLPIYEKARAALASATKE